MIGVAGVDVPELELLAADPATDTERGLRRRARERSAEISAGRQVSRAYAFPYAVIACHAHPVGIDIEAVAPCDLVFAASICTPAELGELRMRDETVISMWSAKEALAKALGDARLYDPRRLGSPSNWTEGRSGPWRARPLELAPGYRGWVCWRAVPVEPAAATRPRRLSSTVISGP